MPSRYEREELDIPPLSTILLVRAPLVLSLWTPGLCFSQGLALFQDVGQQPCSRGGSLIGSHLANTVEDRGSGVTGRVLDPWLPTCRSPAGRTQLCLPSQAIDCCLVLNSRPVSAPSLSAPCLLPVRCEIGCKLNLMGLE